MTKHLLDQASIDHLGPNRRLIFTVPSVEGGQYEQIVVKLILPADLMVTLAYMAVGAQPGLVSPELLALGPCVAN
jgi:hypothetical protein